MHQIPHYKDMLDISWDSVEIQHDSHTLHIAFPSLKGAGSQEIVVKKTIKSGSWT